MKNLTTRKIVLGLLVGLVLALGVQGTADAITKFTRGSGDLKTYAQNQPITISFTVGTQSASIRPNYKSVPVANRTDRQIATYYEEDSTPGYQAESQVPYADAHYYDQESIQIAVTGANITKVGNYQITPTTSHTMSDGGENAAKLSNSVTLTLVATAAGTVEIDITDTTPTADRPAGVGAAAQLDFTVYVVANPTAVTSAELTVTPLERRGFDDFSDPTIGATAIGDNVRVKYEVVSGSGEIYVNVTRTDGDYMGSKGRSLTTSSSATVKVDMNGTTNKVTITVVGSNNYVPPQTVFFIYGLPSLEATQGSSGQKGATSGRLENPLGIRVKDGKGRTISGLGVTFTTSATGAAFIPIPSIPQTMYTFDPSTPQTITVETNNSGVAETYYQLGSSAGMETITAAAAGVTRSDLLTATAESITSVPNIEIVSGNNQRTDKSGDLENSLVVKVTRRGQRISGTEVTFTANRGILTNTPPSGTDTDTGVDVTDSTDGQGLASVTYLLLDHPGAVEVVASISGTTPTTYRRSVTFNINGSGGGASRDDDTAREPTPTRGSLSISVSPDTGNTRTVTVTALNPAGTQASGISVILNVNNGATLSRTDGPTPLTSTLTLPGTAGDFVLTATTTADYTSDTETITVTLPGTLSLALIGDQVNGQQTVQVTARNAARTLETTAVTVTLSGAGISRTVNVTGTQNIPIPLPTTSGTLTASATGYNPGSITLPARAVGTTTTTTTTTTTQTGTAGVADSIEIDGDRQRSGTVNQ
ncbi:MAG: hypothetical protein F4X55_07905, partial [Candidatus Dadabacteria bacterium]|nr:hypothetical protein [Candidatus Dadabacteria bacterium]